MCFHIKFSYALSFSANWTCKILSHWTCRHFIFSLNILKFPFYYWARRYHFLVWLARFTCNKGRVDKEKENLLINKCTLTYTLYKFCIWETPTLSMCADNSIVSKILTKYLVPFFRGCVILLHCNNGGTFLQIMWSEG